MDKCSHWKERVSDRDDWSNGCLTGWFTFEKKIKNFTCVIFRSSLWRGGPHRNRWSVMFGIQGDVRTSVERQSSLFRYSEHSIKKSSSSYPERRSTWRRPVGWKPFSGFERYTLHRIEIALWFTRTLVCVSLIGSTLRYVQQHIL